MTVAHVPAGFSPSPEQQRVIAHEGEVAEMRYKADITAGALKLPESRLIADLLLRQVDAEGWKDAIVNEERPSGPQPRHGQPSDEADPWSAGDDGAGPVEAGP